MPEIQYRPLTTLDEMFEAAALQKVYWGHHPDALVPAHMMFTIAKYGGHVLAAFDGAQMIGVIIGLLGSNVVESSDRPAMANLVLASKRLVVLPEYRGEGIGFNLKLMQRQAAIKQGVRMVVWTFDPLLSRNAHLNLRKLGCVVQRFIPNEYGTRPDTGLVTLGSSDRLRAEWWVTHRRVDERLNGSRSDLKLAQYIEGNAVIVNPARFHDDSAQPSAVIRQAPGVFALVEIPLNFDAIVHSDEGLARAWQVHIREVTQMLFASGYIITDFLRDHHEGRERGFYLMSYNRGFEFSLN